MKTLFNIIILLFALILNNLVSVQAKQITSAKRLFDIDCSRINKDQISLLVKYKNSKEVSLKSDYFHRISSRDLVKSSSPQTKLVKKYYSAKALKLKKELGKVKVLNYSVDNPITCRDYQRIIFALNSDPAVEYAEPNYLIFVEDLQAVPNDPYSLPLEFARNTSPTTQWYLNLINAYDAYDISEGDDIVVAVVDTGIDYNHPDLWNNIWVNPDLVSDRNADDKINLDDLDLNGNKFIDANEIIENAIGFDFIGSDADPIESFDVASKNQFSYGKNIYAGHGTHVAGIIAAESNNNLGIAGIAPKAKILPVRALNFNAGAGSAESSSSLDIMISALNYVAELNVSQVVNNSWGIAGNDFSSQTLEDSFELLAARNMISIASAGNDRISEKNYPAAYDSVVAVAASPSTRFASFSNFGEWVDIAAPGDVILSTAMRVPENEISDFNNLCGTDCLFDEQTNYWYTDLKGTSMSAPIISGLAALMRKRNPNLTVNNFKKIIKSSVQDFPIDGQDETRDIYYIGTGLVDIVNSLNNATLTEFPVANLSDDTYIVTDSLSLQGIASAANFNRYTIEILPENKAYFPSKRVYEASFQTPVNSQGTLANIDFSAIPDGNYTLLLKVFNSTNTFTSAAAKIHKGLISAPSNFAQHDAGSQADSKITLRWEYLIAEAETSGVSSFELYKNDQLLSTIDLNDTIFSGRVDTYRYEYIDTNVTAGTEYTYKLRAVSSSLGNSDFLSLSITTAATSSREKYQAYAAVIGAIGFKPGEDGYIGLNAKTKRVGAIHRSGDFLYLADGQALRVINFNDLSLSTVAGSLRFTEEYKDAIGAEARFPNLIDIGELSDGSIIISTQPEASPDIPLSNFSERGRESANELNPNIKAKLRKYNPSTGEVSRYLATATESIQGVREFTVLPNDSLVVIDRPSEHFKDSDGAIRNLNNPQDRLLMISASGVVEVLISNERLRSFIGDDLYKKNQFPSAAEYTRAYKIQDLCLSKLDSDIVYFASLHQIFQYKISTDQLSLLTGKNDRTIRLGVNGNLEETTFRAINHIDCDSQDNLFVDDQFQGMRRIVISGAEAGSQTIFSESIDTAASSLDLNNLYGEATFPISLSIDALYIDSLDSIHFVHAIPRSKRSQGNVSIIETTNFLSKAILESNIATEFKFIDPNFVPPQEEADENESDDDSESGEDDSESGEDDIDLGNDNLSNLSHFFKDRFGYFPKDTSSSTFNDKFLGADADSLSDQDMQKFQLIDFLLNSSGSYDKSQRRELMKNYRQARKASKKQNGDSSVANIQFDFNSDNKVNKQDRNFIRSVIRDLR